MKGKILGLLAVALVAGPMAANAAYLYTFSNSLTTPTASLNFTVSDFVTTTRSLPFTSQTADGVTFNGAVAQFCQGYSIFTFTTGSFSNLSDCNSSNSSPTFLELEFGAVPQSVGSFNAVTITTAGLQSSIAYLTISAVPEPGTLALLGLGLAGLGLSRRRKPN